MPPEVSTFNKAAHKDPGGNYSRAYNKYSHLLKEVKQMRADDSSKVRDDTAMSELWRSYEVKLFMTVTSTALTFLLIGLLIKIINDRYGEHEPEQCSEQEARRFKGNANYCTDSEEEDDLLEVYDLGGGSDDLNILGNVPEGQSDAEFWENDEEPRHNQHSSDTAQQKRRRKTWED